MARKPYTFRLNEDLMEKGIRPLAEKDYREFTNLIETILMKFAKKNGYKAPKKE